MNVMHASQIEGSTFKSWRTIVCFTSLSGEQQRSVLGQILYPLYVNGIVIALHPNIELRVFANDCLICCRFKNVSDQVFLNECQQRVYVWYITWDIEISFDK